MMPVEVLQRAADEMLDWQGSGMSVIEDSHRGKAFVACAADVEERLRRVLDIPPNYSVLFLQGGASGQFAAVPMNLAKPGERAGYLKTGSWGGKAISAAKGQAIEVVVLADEADSRYTTVPAEGSYTISGDLAYLHYTPNETIGGVEFGYIPASGDVPLVADASSTILSRPLDVARYGVMYAGAQKNMGPAGLTIALVREDLLGHARPETPSVWNYEAMAGADSMLNTPPTFSIYLLGLVLEWIEAGGGLAAMGERNQAKASALYAAIDTSDFYTNPVALDARSWMNIPFTLADADLDPVFLAAAKANGLVNLKGHRSVGGMRASIYNAMPMAGVQALIDFMKDFEKEHG
jgi:phosphoserine aminotransferase